MKFSKQPRTFLPPHASRRQNKSYTAGWVPVANVPRQPSSLGRVLSMLRAVGSGFVSSLPHLAHGSVRTQAGPSKNRQI